MVNFNLPISAMGSNKLPNRREEANANIARMENAVFSSFGMNRNQVKGELERIQKAFDKELDTEKPPKKDEEGTSAKEEIRIEPEEEDTTDQKKPAADQEWKCICDHTKNARISDLFRKFDAFKEIGDVRLNVWNVRKRQFESKLGPRLKNELRKTVLPPPIEPETRREINEDTIWLSDIDRQLIRFIHKPPLSRLKNFEKFVKEPGKTHDRGEEEDAFMERCDLVLRTALRRADKIFREAMKQHVMKLRKLERKKYEAKLALEMEKERIKHEEEMHRNLLKLKGELDMKHEMELKILKDSMSCELSNAVKMKETEIKELHSFNAQWTILDNNERTQNKMKLFHRRCCEWMKKLRRQMKYEEKTKGRLVKMAYTKRNFDFLTKIKIQQRKHLLRLELKHEKIERSLLGVLVNTMCELEEARWINTKMTKEKTIGMDLVKQLMGEYQKFIAYVLKEEHGQGEYLLSYQRMLQLQLDKLYQDKDSEDSTEDDFNEHLLSKLKVKMDQIKDEAVSLKSSSDEDALLTRPDLDLSALKIKTAKHIMKDAIAKALPTPIDSEVEMGQVLKSKSKKTKDPFGCICSDTSQVDVCEFTDEEIENIPQGMPIVGRYISALDYLLKTHHKPHTCDEVKTKKVLIKGLKKQIKPPKAEDKKAKPEHNELGKIMEKLEHKEGETNQELLFSSSLKLNFEEFKKKRIKAMVDVIGKHSILMKKIVI